ncbi:nuclear transport factor 2 family protein [Phenylobacterium sp.]|uniref:nuclear transport factor 2 family protein n=1 Tax=Phenylobacterium sp. TaxID=1871053 RepID=UPI0025F756E3|nr:nuclear transport factor 2 family protein [Phenylobacterium sp.]
MTDAHAAEMAALADRFFGAIEAGDIATVADCYHADAVIWHNDDGLETTPAQNLEVLKAYVANVPRREYANRRFFAIAGGFVQQHDTTLHLADGRVRVLPVCIVFQVDGGKIRRLDEYLDRATLQRWAGEAKAG